jgi:hypothetical protein
MISRFPPAIGIACFILCGCIFNSGESSSGPQLKAGAYYSDYGSSGRSQGYESEIVLGADGRFHSFDLQDTTAWDIIKGVWESHDGLLIVKSGLERVAHYSYLFASWDTLPNDTSYLRAVSDDAFERLDVSRDSGLYYPVVRWVRYNRIEPAQIADGRYQYTEIYRDKLDSTLSHTGVSYMDLTRGGKYEDGRTTDGKPYWKFRSPNWTQLGDFLVVTGAEVDNYDSSGADTTIALDSNSEYVARIRAAGPDSLQQWIPFDQSFTTLGHWVTWRRTPLP